MGAWDVITYVTATNSIQKRAVLQTQSIEKKSSFPFPWSSQRVSCSAFESSLCGDPIIIINPLAVETYGNWGEGGSECFFPACFSAFHQPGHSQTQNVERNLWPPQHVTGEVCSKGHHGKGSCPRVGWWNCRVISYVCK